VDIRPKFDLPDLSSLSVTVDDTLVTPDEVAERLAMLQDRFASLKGVQRPVADGDHVSIDLSASVDGKPVEDAQASGLSYPVGSESLLDGLDEALIGMSAGESKTFSSELAGGDLAGQEADVTVTVHSVKAKDVPGPGRRLRPDGQRVRHARRAARRHQGAAGAGQGHAAGDAGA
jgi:FKBP-type peptidyl-prolyl cis-trans isomerase (trigger factor)